MPAVHGSENWEARDDLRTMVEAEKIKANPKRLMAAMAERNRQIAELEKLDSKGAK